jgi:signal transduction histidine kinase
MTLQSRVTSALVALLSVFVVAQALLAYLSLEEQEDRMADEMVAAEAKQLALYAERGDLDGLRASDVLDRSTDVAAWLVRPDGSTVPEPLPEPLAGLGSGPHRLSGSLSEHHVMVVPTSAGRLVVRYDAHRNEAQVHQYAGYLAGLGALCIVLGAVVARQLARVVVAPLERLTVRLSEWAPEVSTPTAGASDEEARLLEAFGRMQARFEQAIAREREFAANVGHELRTPLAALRTDLELLAEAPGLAHGPRERVGRMLASVDAIAGSIASAQSLATDGQRAAADPVDLARCVDDAWLTLEPAAMQRGLSFENRVPRGTTARIDRHALLTILRNLLRNAAEHAAPARCVVSGDGAALTVEDDGPGIGADELPHLFERSWRGQRADAPREDAPGRGLGLAIARRMAELNGWQLGAAPRAGGGLRFTLTLGGARHDA